MIDLSLIILNNTTINKNTTAKVKCTFNLVRFFCCSVPSFFCNPKISIQKQDVSDVIAPSTLGKSAEIKAIIKIVILDIFYLTTKKTKNLTTKKLIIYPHRHY